jgi:hypothetical protein
MLIVLSGKARSGKDTLADILIDLFKEKTNDDFRKVAYADSLKEKLMLEFDLSWDQVYGDLKEVPDKRFVKKIKKTDSYTDGKVWTDKDLYWSPREIMQFIGTDCYRAVDDSFWVKSLFNKINKNGYKNVIISDGRFPSEIDPVVDLGGYHIRVFRSQQGSLNNKTHESEVALDNDYKIDFTVINDGSIDDLKKTASSIVTMILKGVFNKKIIDVQEVYDGSN